MESGDFLTSFAKGLSKETGCKINAVWRCLLTRQSDKDVLFRKPESISYSGLILDGKSFIEADTKKNVFALQFPPFRNNYYFLAHNYPAGMHSAGNSTLSLVCSVVAKDFLSGCIAHILLALIVVNHWADVAKSPEHGKAIRT